MDDHRDHRKEIGALGERLVAEALEARGFRILARNFRCRWGEIDLVARNETALWFVEVKTRTSSTPPWPVSWRQQQRITRTAYRFLANYLERGGAPRSEIQFVVAAVCFRGNTPHIDWIEQAFESTF